MAQTDDASADPATCGCTPPEEEKKPIFNIYGFVMLDMIYDFKTNNPDWFDVVRPTKLPAFEGEFGEDGHFYGSVRQTRFGMKANFPTHLGEVKTIFEFELFGTGVDAGANDIPFAARLRRTRSFRWRTNLEPPSWTRCISQLAGILGP